LAQFKDSSNPAEREIGNGAVKAKEEYKTGTAAVKKETRVKTAKTRVEVEFKDQPLKIERDERGEFTAESMIDLVSDLDGKSGVEQTNRGLLRRALFGGTDQKEIIGEQQLKHALSGKSREQLDEIYRRVTGNTS